MNETTAVTYKCIKCQQPITGHQSYWFSDSGGPYCSHCIPKPQWPNHTVRLWVAPTITGRRNCHAGYCIGIGVPGAS